MEDPELTRLFTAVWQDDTLIYLADAVAAYLMKNLPKDGSNLTVVTDQVKVVFYRLTAKNPPEEYICVDSNQFTHNASWFTHHFQNTENFPTWLCQQIQGRKAFQEQMRNG